MLLCRHAENVFWLGRYLERAENLSRAAIAYSELCLDMPKPMSPGYGPLLCLSLGEEPPASAPGGRDPTLLTVLCGAHDNSIRELMRRARENLRVSRAIVPEASWNFVNEAHESLARVDQATGHELLHTLESVSRDCQLITSEIIETMTRDDAYFFLEVGRFLERANMVLRVMQMSQQMHAFDPSVPFDDVRFMGLLHCLGAYQMFRRRYHGRTVGRPVLSFLLKDADFPRSLAHCLVRIDRALAVIPKSGPLRQQTEELMVGGLPKNPSEPGAFVEHLLEALAELTGDLTRTYFHPEPEPSRLRFTALA